MKKVRARYRKAYGGDLCADDEDADKFCEDDVESDDDADKVMAIEPIHQKPLLKLRNEAVCDDIAVRQNNPLALCTSALFAIHLGNFFCNG